MYRRIGLYYAKLEKCLGSEACVKIATYPLHQILENLVQLVQLVRYRSGKAFRLKRRMQSTPYLQVPPPLRLLPV